MLQAAQHNARRRRAGQALLAAAAGGAIVTGAALASQPGGTTAPGPAAASRAPAAPAPSAGDPSFPPVLQSRSYPAEGPSAAERAAARQLDATWRQARVKFQVVDEQIRVLGTWATPTSPGATALTSGLVTYPATLPALPARMGTLSWQDGSTAALPVIDAATALSELQQPRTTTPCSCRPLVLTDAKLEDIEVDTTRGPAQAPAWTFALPATDAAPGQTLRVAVLAVSQTSVPLTHPSLPPSPHINAARVVSGALTLSFPGFAKDASEQCGEDYTAVVIETPSTVMVTVHRHAGAPAPANASCKYGATRTATATLSAPLGGRPILQLSDGEPLPLKP
ncbi:hypothetical protein [Motilibacter rhizosphaerae]|uniref:hypothetical protein n=1 Tax=Motilibacter rhizosphaerae TaxID=598652 RepID=UPI00102CE2FE|nr:hypothetical protein [Motilibacter rhizosphaerae]